MSFEQPNNPRILAQSSTNGCLQLSASYAGTSAGLPITVQVAPTTISLQVSANSIADIYMVTVTATPSAGTSIQTQFMVFVQ